MSNASLDVAVVIPAFRSERWIGEAIASVLAQTRAPAEIIVVDDGSPDATEEAVAPFLGKVVYARQRNGGPAAARNTGVALTEAPWIAFLDADDLWEPEKLATQARCLSERPGLSMVCSDCWVFGHSTPVARKNGALDAPLDLSLPGLLRRNPVVTSTVLVRREAFEDAGGFDEDRALIAVEDFDLWLKLAERAAIGYVDAPLGRYRQTATSLSGPRRFLDGVQRVLENAVVRSPRYAALRPQIRARICTLQCDLAWHLLEEDQGGAAVRPILEALAESPSRPEPWRLLARALLQQSPLAGRWLGLSAGARGASARA